MGGLSLLTELPRITPNTVSPLHSREQVNSFGCSVPKLPVLERTPIRKVYT